MNPEHYVRPDGDQDSKSSIPPANTWSRMARRLTNFMFNKTPDPTPPGIFPNNGFNSNGRRHS